MKKNRYLGQAKGNRFCIKGINVLDCKWQNIGKVAIVTDVKTDRQVTVSGYKAVTGNSEVSFLARQDENGVWSFYDIDE